MVMTRNPVKPRQRATVQAAIRATAFTRVFTGGFTGAVTDAFTPPVLASLICMICLTCLTCLVLAGCAGPSAGTNPQATMPAFRDPAMSIQSANASIAIGTSTRAEVLAALGPASVVKFDSGYEVWVYRGKSPNTATKPAELVILFAPSGVVKKTRIKPLY